MSDAETPGAPRIAPAPASAWWSRLVLRKGQIGPVALAALAAAACLPLLMAFSRLLALPGADALPIAGAGWLRGLGAWLNQTLTLEWVPPSDRPEILYLLLLPTGALLVALARLTLGLRVLGLRAILLAIGFHASGLVPSLVLMLVIVATILAIRPWMRRIRLPLYARITVVLSLTSAIMVAALLIAPWLRSEAVWGVAFFPAIIMAMLAEGVAKTVEQDDAVMAAWRAGWTVVLALVIALVDGAVARFVYPFPELILTQTIAIVLVAELLDLRLLEAWPARLSRLLAGRRPWFASEPRIAVVRNRDGEGVIGRLGPLAPASYRQSSVQRPVDALREQGYHVRVVEGDLRLLRELERFLPPQARRGSPGGIVLNLATGAQGEGRSGHVPAMLEMAGIPYTGPGPLAHARLTDRHLMLTLLQQAGVPVPRHRLVAGPADTVDLEPPLAVRPQLDPDADPIVAGTLEQVRAAVRDVQRLHPQPAVVEELARGRTICVALIGNGAVECLPLLERSAGDEGRLAPARLDEHQERLLRRLALAAFAALGCRDYASVDIRIPPLGDPVVVAVGWADLLTARGALVLAAEAAGHTLPALMQRIVAAAASRYAASEAPPASTLDPQGSAAVVSLAERRAAAK